MGNRLVVITGASAGIGRETAKYLADAAYSVIACARSEACDLDGYTSIRYR